MLYYKHKTKKIRNVRTVPKSNRKLTEAEEISIPLTHIYMTTHWPGLVHPSINKSGRAKLLLLVQTSLLSAILRSC